MSYPPPPPHPSLVAAGYAFREVVVEHVTDGTFHVVAPYVKTDEEAKKLARMTWPDSKQWRLRMRREVATKSIKCSRCGLERIVAYGNNAMLLTMPAIYVIARKIGWAMNPKQVCPACL